MNPHAPKRSLSTNLNLSQLNILSDIDSDTGAGSSSYFPEISSSYSLVDGDGMNRNEIDALSEVRAAHEPAASYYNTKIPYNTYNYKECENLNARDKNELFK